MKADVLKADEKTDRRKRLNSLEEHYRTQAICLAFFSNRDLLDKLQHYSTFPKTTGDSYPYFSLPYLYPGQIVFAFWSVQDC